MFVLNGSKITGNWHLLEEIIESVEPVSIKQLALMQFNNLTENNIMLAIIQLVQ
jgi:hypothetical protein